MIRRGTALPTGPRTSSDNDVADPHPSDEKHYDRVERPGGAVTPRGEAAGIENARHNGLPARRPRNAETQ